MGQNIVSLAKETLTAMKKKTGKYDIQRGEITIQEGRTKIYKNVFLPHATAPNFRLQLSLRGGIHVKLHLLIL
jgi:hypothetical protein